MDLDLTRADAGPHVWEGAFSNVRYGPKRTLSPSSRMCYRIIPPRLLSSRRCAQGHRGGRARSRCWRGRGGCGPPRRGSASHATAQAQTGVLRARGRRSPSAFDARRTGTPRMPGRVGGARGDGRLRQTPLRAPSSAVHVSLPNGITSAEAEGAATSSASATTNSASRRGTDPGYIRDPLAGPPADRRPQSSVVEG